MTPVEEVKQDDDADLSPKRDLLVPAGIGALTLGALGVVFGDIGTSPLYAMHTVFAERNNAIDPTQSAVYGIISMVFWSITLVVSVKYLTFVMRADNEGEGGIMALIALIQRLGRQSGLAGKSALVALGVFGAALFFGDAMITPAISVLSAVEGMEVISPGLKELVIPISLTLIILLFAIQRFGTGLVGRLFGPICIAWFIALAAGGIPHVIEHPGILRSLSPTYAFTFAFEHFGLFFIALSGVVLVITGVEALYADMGHFGRRAIRLGWFFVVFPALTLNYMGQGALILHSPETALENPFFLLYPDWALVPMVILATAATVIASQAVISGAFSVSRQAVQLGYLPRLNIRHTSNAEVGQIYVPAINWGVLVAVIVLILGFRSSANLAAAYGIAVTGTLAIDTILFFTVVRTRFRKPIWMVAFGGAVLLTVDLMFFSANVPKLFQGGWFPVLIAIALFTVFITWSKGRALVSTARMEEEGPLRDFIEEIHSMDPMINRAPGTAIFLNADSGTTPLALRANFEHNHTLHESVVIVSIVTAKVPYVEPEERVTVDDLGYADDGIAHVTVRFGFQDLVDVPGSLRLAEQHGLEVKLDLENASYFLSRVVLRRGPDRNMAKWRKVLFLTLARQSSNPVEYFNLPIDRTIVMGGHVTL